MTEPARCDLTDSGAERRGNVTTVAMNRNETFSGGYTYYPDNPTRSWEADQIGKGIFYYERQLNEAFLTVYT